MTVENTQVDDVFAMSSEDFASNYGSDTVFTTSDDESASADLSTDEVEPLNELDGPVGNTGDIGVEGEDGTIENTIEHDADAEDESEASASDTGAEQESEDVPDEFDYASAYNELFEPLKANGKEYNIDSVEDARKLMQMGMGYYKNMEALKPQRKLMAMIEANSIDEDKLNFAIDLLNKNPQAINKLIEDQDLSEIVDDSNSNYTPSNHGVSEKQLDVKSALQEIEQTPTYLRTVNVLGKEWDDASREVVQEHTHLISTINSHIESGMYDRIIAEVDKRKMFGSIPQGTPDIYAYKMVGDEMYANDTGSTAPNMGQQRQPVQANAKPPIRKPSEQVRQNKIAASKPRSSVAPRQVKKVEDVFAMSDAEFNKKYGFN